jgi:hypothetical protein
MADRARVVIVFPGEPHENGEKLVDFVIDNRDHIAQALRNAMFWPTWLDFDVTGELEGWAV